MDLPSGDQAASRSWALEVLDRLRGVPSLAGTEKMSPRATTDQALAVRRGVDAFDVLVGVHEGVAARTRSLPSR